MAVISRVIMLCDNCREYISECDQCYTKFRGGESILCHDGLHFCSYSCLQEYFEKVGDE